MKGYVYFAKFITFVKTAINTCVRVIPDSNLFTERNLKTWDFFLIPGDKFVITYRSLTTSANNQDIYL